MSRKSGLNKPKMRPVKAELKKWRPKGEIVPGVRPEVRAMIEAGLVKFAHIWQELAKY